MRTLFELSPASHALAQSLCWSLSGVVLGLYQGSEIVLVALCGDIHVLPSLGAVIVA